MKRGVSVLVLGALVGAVGCSSAATSDDVGEVASPVIGGASYGGHPAVLLFNVDGHNDAGNYDYFGTCTATLIAPDVVLTAAHCVEDYAKNHEVGRVSNAQAPNRADASQWTKVASVDIHPAWATQQYINEGHDCAILKLERPLAGVSPIKVYRGTNTARDLAVGNAVKIIGYGNNDGNSGTGAGTKRYLDSSIHDVYDGVIGAGRTGATSCQGDSGGGLLEVIDGVEQVIGVTSFGAPKCIEQGYWTNVSKTCLDLVRKYVPDGDTPPPDPTCSPKCAGKTCGDDGCGGVCGTCASGMACSAAGSCVTIPTPAESCNEKEPNNDSGSTNKLCAAGHFAGATSGTDYDYVGFTVMAGRTYTLAFTSASSNANFVLYKSTASGWSQIGQGPGALSRQTADGGSYVAITWSTNGANATYDLSITK
ncbi:MAG: trypsin-like serine protease [Polyangiaceae bacterium]